MPKLILGHTTDSSIKIWVRGSERWPVAFVDVLDDDDNPVGKTQSLGLSAEEFYTGVIEWKRLQANSQYRVKVAFGKSKETPRRDRIREAYSEGRFFTFPDSSNDSLSFLLGSCNLHSLGIFEKPDKAWVRISNLARENNARFMIHCGDQIYADIPLPPRTDFRHYRDKYLDAWEDCRPAQRVLTELPHYMILDDHEITDNFDRDMNPREGNLLLDVAMKVYYEFQHKHNPELSGGERRYYYHFSYGAIQFFVLDTRYRRESEIGQMIDPTQLTVLKRWLTRHRDAMKFVVTSVPFVGQVRRSKKDKWCDPVYQGQRMDILNHIVDREIGKLVFLTGDMHTSYHASLRIEKGDKISIVHELMSSPINQITPDTQLEEKYDSPHVQEVDGVKVISNITPETFYGNHSNVMAVEVNGDKVDYRIYRTTRDEKVAVAGSFLP